MEHLSSEFSYEPALPFEVAALRLLGAVVFCGLIGLERESRDRPAGLRTHILIGLASAIYTIIMLELTGRSYGADVRLDPIRIVEAVTGGVAFLAAGMIVFAKGEVKGLTTGAGMWLSAAIGLSTGLGMWLLAALATVLGLIVIALLRIVESKVMGSR